MNLPVVLDIAIGLVFIYLIASLLASEIQELLSTLLQWRAKHLRESIHNLLSGGYGTQEADQLGGFIERIYNDPLIKNVNQSARGLIGFFGQWCYRNIFYRRSVFGQATSAPSYISPETFSTALLEQLGMSMLIEKLTEIRLEKFLTRIVGLSDTTDGTVTIPEDSFFQDKDNWEKGGIRVLAAKARCLAQEPERMGETATAILTLNTNEDFLALAEDYEDILRDFRSGEASLETCVERMQEGLDLYINQIGEKIPPDRTAPAYEFESAGLPSVSPLEKKQLLYFKKRLHALRLSTFGEKSERAVISGKLKPSLLEIAQVFDRASTTYQEVETAYRDVASAYEVATMPDRVQPLLSAIASQVSQISTAGGMGLQGSVAEAGRMDSPHLAIMDLLKEDCQSQVSDVLATLSASEQQTYKGWTIYQQIILKVMIDIAEQLQRMGRLFDASDRELTQSLSNLRQLELDRSVKYSLELMSNEESQLCINNALNRYAPEQRKVFRNYQSYEQIQDILSRVPTSVKQSLSVLARRAQTKVGQTERQLNQFNTEVSIWFDRSMGRASGVYKRNAKGVAIMIGFLIAFVSNADTFHIVTRLAGDEDLRQVIANRANEVTQNVVTNKQEVTKEDLRRLKNTTDAVLEDVQLPVRWLPVNLRQQFSCPVQNETVNPNDWDAFYRDCLPRAKGETQARLDKPIGGFHLWKVMQIATRPDHLIDIARMFIGWLTSGIAIAMGAPFWFDILGKLMNVRNAGTKPASVADKEPQKPG
jgi:hypothetical protein